MSDLAKIFLGRVALAVDFAPIMCQARRSLALRRLPTRPTSLSGSISSARVTLGLAKTAKSPVSPKTLGSPCFKSWAGSILIGRFHVFLHQLQITTLQPRFHPRKIYPIQATYQLSDLCRYQCPEGG